MSRNGHRNRARTPTVFQMEATECGAASLGMVLGYHGCHEPIEKLRVACGVSRNGSQASLILKAARSYGLEARGFKVSVEALGEKALPAILFWNFEHFVVYEGRRGDEFFINDPASVPASLSSATSRSDTAGSPPPLIEGFSLALEAGSRVALVGSSGSGKSTIAKIAAGLFAPWQGEILLGGQPLASWSRDEFYRSVASVDQNIILFSGTVRDNLTLFQRHSEACDLHEALGDAGIVAELARRGNELEIPVGEMGNNFSGGQRLEIARALARNAPILILDEATTALLLAPYYTFEVPVTRAISSFFAVPTFAPSVVKPDSLPKLTPDLFLTALPSVELWTRPVVAALRERGFKDVLVIGPEIEHMGGVFAAKIED